MNGRTLIQYIIDISVVVPAKKQEASEYLANAAEALATHRQDGIMCPPSCFCWGVSGYLDELEAAQSRVQADVAYWSCKCGASNNSVEFNWCYACGSPRN